MNGYNPDHLDGITLPLPSFSIELQEELLNNGEVFDYPNYSLIMNAHPDKRSAVITCQNIDQNKYKKVDRGRWRLDGRVGRDNQLDNDYYRRNPLDRGHLVRSKTAGWGDTSSDAQHATRETFYYTNSVLQHENLNQDEWLHDLEEWVRTLRLDKDGRLTVFSGPFYGRSDRTVRPSGRRTALVPAGFFKIVCFINKDTDTLDVRAFVMFQDHTTLADKDGHKKFNNQHYQVTVSEVEALTGLKFDNQIFHANPLIADATTARARNIGEDQLPERHEVAKPEDILSADSPRIILLDDVVDIFISAAMPNPDGADAGNEWVALLNMGGETIDVSEWTLEDNSNKKLKIGDRFDDSTVLNLEPGQSIKIIGLAPLKLSNTKDVIKLFDNNNNRIDWVNYFRHMVAPGKPINFLAARDTLD